jgi:predicted RNA-binding Zn-ribbon protein involved in translation (DUF1610 family)
MLVTMRRKIGPPPDRQNGFSTEPIPTVLYIRRLGKLAGMAVVDSGDVCPNCGAKLGKKNGNPVKTKVTQDVNGKPGVKFTCPKCGTAGLFSSSPQVIND